MKSAVTYLFVPGNRPDRFDKALASGADAVIVDLEDAVADEDKAQARANLREWIDVHRDVANRIVVRINDRSTPWFDADLDVLRSDGIALVMLPKAEEAGTIEAVVSALGRHARILPLIETALGIRNVEAVANASGVQRLAFGTLDYAVDLGLSGDDRGLAYPSARISLASRCAGLASPIAGVTPDIDDDACVLSDLAFARAFGFGAKLCIHPRQVGVIQRAMQPTPVELEWARKVVEAADGAQGAVKVDGKMVDRPVIAKARAIMGRAPN